MGGNDLHLVAVHGIVIRVALWNSFGIRQALGHPRLRSQRRTFLLIQEGLWHFIVCGVLRLGHEAVDGDLVLGFMNDVSETMKYFDHSDCPQEEV